MRPDADERLAEIRRALDRVDDPELDEPVTDLRFIERITQHDDGDVAVAFRLPTYWCAPNFAFLMADDMRREIGTLPWVRRVMVTLGEHMYADTINHGLANGLSFQDAFGKDANGGLDDLRRTFLVKAFQRRQEKLLRHLLGAGHAASGLAGLTLDALRAWPLSPDGAALRARYLDRRDVCAQAGEPLAFVDAQGRALPAATFPAYLQALARVGVNAEFNGALCRGLLAARFNEAMPAGEPTLLDFARMTSPSA